jgi:hypothetical protein
MYHFDKIRDDEWGVFMHDLKKTDKKQYNKLREVRYRDRGYLMINFLLTQTNMNITNIGYVSGDRLGLGAVASEEDINRQLFSGTDSSVYLNEEELKVRLKRVISRQDISFLLHGIDQASKLRIGSEQDSIKQNLGVRSVLDLSHINQTDLCGELVRIGFVAYDANSMAKIIITKAQEYQAALHELQINID